ncbi:MAG TPA: hypothetical protein VNQ73_00020, partial [Ilumatobacter sp.]|nr:hypothetical protein [Ilumatobacter sp.]
MTALPPARRSAHSAQPGSSAPGRKRPGQLLAVVLAGVLVVATIAARSGASEATIDGEHEGSGPDVGGQVLALQVGGRADVPLDAAAVVLNVTAVGPAGPGYVTAFPCDQQRPLASNLNYAPGDVVANLVIAKPDAA